MVKAAKAYKVADVSIEAPADSLNPLPATQEKYYQTSFVADDSSITATAAATGRDSPTSIQSQRRSYRKKSDRMSRSQSCQQRRTESPRCEDDAAVTTPNPPRLPVSLAETMSMGTAPRTLSGGRIRAKRCERRTPKNVIKKALNFDFAANEVDDLPTPSPHLPPSRQDPSNNLAVPVNTPAKGSANHATPASFQRIENERAHRTLAGAAQQLKAGYNSLVPVNTPTTARAPINSATAESLLLGEAKRLECAGAINSRVEESCNSQSQRTELTTSNFKFTENLESQGKKSEFVNSSVEDICPKVDPPETDTALPSPKQQEIFESVSEPQSQKSEFVTSDFEGSCPKEDTPETDKALPSSKLQEILESVSESQSQKSEFITSDFEDTCSTAEPPKANKKIKAVKALPSPKLQEITENGSESQSQKSEFVTSDFEDSCPKVKPPKATKKVKAGKALPTPKLQIILENESESQNQKSNFEDNRKMSASSRRGSRSSARKKREVAVAESRFDEEEFDVEAGQVHSQLDFTPENLGKFSLANKTFQGIVFLRR